MITSAALFLLLAGLGIALLLVLATLWLGFRPGDDAVLPPPNHVDLADCSIVYYRAGRGPTLLLLHGLGASSFSWRYLFPLLSPDFELIAVDLPGFGGSSKSPDLDFGLDAQVDRLDRLVRILGLKPSALVGSSLGGLLALTLARRDPVLYPRVIALAPAALGSLLRWPLARFRQKAKYLRFFINRFTMPLLVAAVNGGTRPIHRGSLKKYLEPYRDPRLLPCFFASFEAMADPRLPRLLEDLKIPILVLWGERDLQVTWRAIAALQAVLPAAQIKRLANLPHHLHESHPEVIAAEIRLWLEKNL